jgi:hypothetical protein
VKGLAAGLAVVMAVGTSTPSVRAAEDPLAQARRATATLRFTALVDYQWVDLFGAHQVTLQVAVDQGRVVVTGPGGRRISLPGDGSPLDPPAVAGKYRFETEGRGSVAGRPVDVVAVLERGVVRERLAVDRATGLVLQRQVLGADGSRLRVVTVQQLAVASSAGARARRSAPVANALAALPSFYRAPVTLAGGYARVAAVRQANVVQLSYTDGLHGLSVFAQIGRMDRGRLPAGGRAVQVGRWQAVVYDWPGGEAIAWQAGPVVYTVVGDAAVDEILAAAGSLPGPGRPAVTTRVRRASRAVAQALFS